MSVSRLAAALGVCLLCLSLHRPARAAEPDVLEQVKRELAELRRSYEARLQSLEKRIVELQAQGMNPAPAPQQATAAASAGPAAAVPNAAPVDAGAAAPVAAGAASTNAATAFNPSISLILAG